MSRWGRDYDEIWLDIAAAIGDGRDVLEALAARHEREWTAGTEDR